MEAIKKSETYIFKDVDPVNDKPNVLYVTILFRENRLDIWRQKVSENSDIIQEATIFCQEVLQKAKHTHVIIPKPTIVK